MGPVNEIFPLQLEDIATMQLLLWLAVGHTWTFVSGRKLFSFHKKGIVGLQAESFTGWT